MLTYPQLTQTEQAELPKLLAAPIPIPSRFIDSTHQVWHCQTADGEMVLKICNSVRVAHSTFWLGLNHLFRADFPNSIGDIQDTHDFLCQNGTLYVPAFVASKANRFVLTRFLAGEDVDSAHVDNQRVILLAKHIASLHQHTNQHWGNLHAPSFTAQDWSIRLQNTLQYLAEQSSTPIDDDFLAEQLKIAGSDQKTSFIPMMVDLRWDQLRYCDNKALALIDLDAFVFAPKNLDLVLITNLLSPAQQRLFKQEYELVHIWPDFSQQQPCYQLLLFLMQVFGETDLVQWMKRI
jgi:Ser/Thr protein kinase RdoA (MazF antagonist)